MRFLSPASLLVSLILLSLPPVTTNAEQLLPASDKTSQHGMLGLDAPSVGNTSTGLVDAQKDIKAGEWVLRKLNKSAPQIADAWLQDELKLMLNGLSAQAGLPEPLALVVIRDKQINAFATPGGVIGINSGLITKANRADELASVLAHEVAHIAQRHHARRAETASNDLLIQLGGLVAGALLAKENPEAAQAALIGSKAYTIDKQLAYSREHEREADRVGLHILQAAGYDPNAMPDFFETMQAQNQITGYLPSFVLTHPLTLERLSETSQRASTLKPATNPYTKSIQREFDYLYWRTLALSGDAPLALFSKAYANTPTSAISLAWVSALLMQDKVAQAANVMATVDQNDAHPVLFALTQGELLIAQKRYGNSVKWLTKQAQLYPESRALKLTLSKSHILNGSAQQAIAILQPLSQENPRDVLVWRSMFDAAQAIEKQSGNASSTLNEVRALRYRAEFEFWQDDLLSALRSMARAKQLAKELPSQLSQIKTRYNDMMSVYKEELG